MPGATPSPTARPGSPTRATPRPSRHSRRACTTTASTSSRCRRAPPRPTAGCSASTTSTRTTGCSTPAAWTPWTADKVAKSQAAHGVAVVEVALVRRALARRAPVALRAAHHRHARRSTSRARPPAIRWLRTAADPDRADGARDGQQLRPRRDALGHVPRPARRTSTATSSTAASAIPARQKRYGITDKGFGYRWHEHDERFDAARHPNEPNRFGWVVEIDPFDPAPPPVKRTALGRFKHEGAAVTLAADGRVVVYMGDDERGEYIYKFVSDGPLRSRRPGARPSACSTRGTLYVARFDADGTGRWLRARPRRQRPRRGGRLPRARPRC